MNIGKPINNLKCELLYNSVNLVISNSLYNSLTYYLSIAMQYTIWEPINDSVDGSIYRSIINNTL